MADQRQILTDKGIARLSLRVRSNTRSAIASCRVSSCSSASAERASWLKVSSGVMPFASSRPR